MSLDGDEDEEELSWDVGEKDDGDDEALTTTTNISPVENEHIPPPVPANNVVNIFFV